MPKFKGSGTDYDSVLFLCLLLSCVSLATSVAVRGGDSLIFFLCFLFFFLFSVFYTFFLFLFSVSSASSLTTGPSGSANITPFPPIYISTASLLFSRRHDNSTRSIYVRMRIYILQHVAVFNETSRFIYKLQKPLGLFGGKWRIVKQTRLAKRLQS